MLYVSTTPTLAPREGSGASPARRELGWFGLRTLGTSSPPTTITTSIVLGVPFVWVCPFFVFPGLRGTDGGSSLGPPT